MIPPAAQELVSQFNDNANHYLSHLFKEEVVRLFDNQFIPQAKEARDMLATRYGVDVDDDETWALLLTHLAFISTWIHSYLTNNGPEGSNTAAQAASSELAFTFAVMRGQVQRP